MSKEQSVAVAMVDDVFNVVSPSSKVVTRCLQHCWEIEKTLRL